MTARQRLWRVEAPLAAPVAMGGVRTAAVWTIGAATLATPVGQTSLGNYIFSGLQTENWISVLFGCFVAAALALAVDQILALMEAGAARRDARRLIAGASLLVAGTLAALAPAFGGAEASYVVGAKNFSEQFILADLIGTRLQRTGARVEKREGLGSAVVFRALENGDIDVYVDYSGTIWTNVMHRTDSPSRAAMLDEIGKWLPAHTGVALVGSLGFENAYALAMKRDRARALGVATIADLARVAPQLILGSDLEFLNRPEWTALRDAYDLHFQDQQVYNPTIMYRALTSGEADVISAFSSDGRILADNLVTLADPKQAIPAYDAIVLVAPKRVNDRRLRDALRPLIGKIDIDHMRAANLSVDRDTDKRSPAQAAQALAAALGLAR
jgi:osmoprotectant transport system permease protein